MLNKTLMPATDKFEILENKAVHLAAANQLAHTRHVVVENVVMWFVFAVD